MTECELCGGTENVYQHHINYKENKKVPLCPHCHRKVHSDPSHRFYPVDALENIDSRGRVVIPSYILNYWKSDVKIYSGTFSVIIAPTNIDLGDIVKSTEILLRDMRHQVELQRREREEQK